MALLLQQMMGGAGGEGGGDGGLPPGLAELLGQATTSTSASPASDYSYIWQMIHAIFALSLGIYVAAGSSSSFTGSLAQRTQDPDVVDHEAPGSHLFYWFATAQLILQSSRFFLERGRVAGSGSMVTTLATSFLPEPWRSYVLVLSRYAVIYTTIMADAMVLVFVLGAVAWWRGA